MDVWTISLALSVILGALPAPLQTADPARTEELPVPCRPGIWQLKGADYKVQSGSEASYREEWTRTLKEIAVCIDLPQMTRTCIQVRGHSDKIPFTPEVVGAFGSSEAAQIARARGRAISVISRLHELGVAAHKLHEVPPPSTPTFRGVEIGLLSECLFAPGPVAKPTQAERTVLSDESVAAIARQLADQSPARSPVGVEQGLQPGAPLESYPPAVNHFWLEAGLDASLWLTEPSAVFAPMLRLGAGWDNELLYARLNLSPGTGLPDEQRIGLEFSAGAGYVHARWLQLGAVGGLRMSYFELDAPWIERTWFAGLESTQYLFNLGGYQFCLHETLVPIGYKERRADVSGDRIERIPKRSSWVLRFDVALVMRHSFL